jgi:hypothetical protein
MPVDASKVKIAATGSLWRAPLGTTLPTDSTTAYAAAFTNLGYLSMGFELSQDLKQKEITAWQTLEIVRLINTSLTRSISFDAIESNNATVALAWGGATITATTAGVYSLAIPDASAVQEAIYGIDWSDGSTTQRIIIKRGVLKSLPKVKFTREDAIVYSFEIQAITPTDGTKAMVVYGVDAGVAS